MNKKFGATRITLWANRLVAALVAILLFTLPVVLDWYCQYRTLEPQERIALMAAFYSCAVVVGIALWNIDVLLRNILQEEVFTAGNVRCISRIRWCCGCVGLICVPAAMVYYPLIFMVIIMGFLCLVVSVVCRVMDAAVSIREENDLTI